jgi:integrase
MQIKRTSLRPKTAVEYQRIVDAYLTPLIGDIKVHQLVINQVNRLYASMANEGRGTRTIRLTHSVLHSALEHAVKTGLITKNPSHGAMLPRKKYQEMQIYNEEQVNTFLITTEQSRFKVLYQLALATGMRQSELLGLKWSDVDWTKGTINIQRQTQEVKGKGIEFIEPKTRAGVRQIVIGESILTNLQKHRLDQEKAKKKNANNWKDNNLIFATNNGTPFNQRNLLRDYYYRIEQANLPRIRFHDLRHTAASLMINRGIDVVIVSKILGHSKPGVTLNIYAHCISDLQYEAAKVMEELTTPISIDLREFSKKQEK